MKQKTKCPECGAICYEEELVFKDVKCPSWICPKCNIRIVSKQDAMKLDKYNDPEDRSDFNETT